MAVAETAEQQEQLIPDKYPQGDLFICDVADAVLKDIIPQMEHPFYSLSKKPEMTVRHYEHNGNWLEVAPSYKGLATIYDKDILIYAISQVMAKINSGEKVSRRIRMSARDMLMFTNRGTSGRDYLALSESFDRLGGTRIKTNIVIGDEEQTDFLGLIESASIRRKNGLNGRLQWVEITLSEWVFDAIQAKQVLTLNRDYFRLRKPIERRIYELARKHCGQQSSWSIDVKLLHKKSGSQGNIRLFRQALKNLENNNHLPDYEVSYDTDFDTVDFINRNTMPLSKDKKWNGQLKPAVFERLADMNLDIDKYGLEQDFRTWVASKGIEPDNPEGLFLSFAKKYKQRMNGS